MVDTTSRRSVDRLAQRHQPHRLVIDDVLKRVDGLVALAHLLGLFGVPRQQGLGPVQDRVLDKPAHLDDGRLQRLKVPVKGGGDVGFVHGRSPYPIRPEI